MSNKEMMKKTKLFFSLEKELNYINEMNKEGWKLVYIKGGCVYHFEKTEPDEYCLCRSVRLSINPAYDGRLRRFPLSHGKESGGIARICLRGPRKNRKREKNLSPFPHAQHCFRCDFAFPDVSGRFYDRNENG